MNTRVWRRRLNGWGLLLVGGVGTVYSVSQWGLDTPVMTALFGIFALSGAFTVGGRENVYYYLLPVMGVLTFIKTVGYYLIYGITMVTLAFLLLGTAIVAVGVQAYRKSQQDTDAET